MILAYYCLFASILALILVYIVYLTGKIIPKKINYILVYSPAIISGIIIAMNLTTPSSIDLRDLEFTAISIKHYPYRFEELSDKIESHREFFTMTYKDEYGNLSELEINNETYEYFKNLWNKNRTDVPIFDEISQNTEEVFWDNKPSSALVYTKSVPFMNSFKSTLGLYDIVIFTPDQLDLIDVYYKNRNYTINQSHIFEPRQNLVYGIKIPDSIGRKLSNISSVDNNFRPILCVYPMSKITNKATHINYQRSFWKSGCDNEVVFCVGVNNVTDLKITWSGSFSWANDKTLENKIISEVLSKGEKLDLEQYYKSLRSNYMSGYWNPRNFEDYRFLRMPINKLVIYISFIIILLNMLLHRKIVKFRRHNRLV